MEVKELNLVVKEAGSTLDSYEVFASIQGTTLPLPVNSLCKVQLTPPLPLELSLSLRQNGAELSQTSVSLADFSGRVPRELSLSDAISVVLEGEITDLAPTQCTYLAAINKTKAIYEHVEHTIGNLQEELGSSYAKLLQESVRLRSPQKSPVKRPQKAPGKKTPGTPSKTPTRKAPAKSPYARGSIATVPEKRETLVVPASVEVSLESVAQRDFPTLVYSVLGLLAKKEVGLIQRAQTAAMEGLTAETDPVLQLQQTEQFRGVSQEKLDHFEAFINTTKTGILADLDESERCEKEIKQTLEMSTGLGMVIKGLTRKASTSVNDPPSIQDTETQFLELASTRQQLCAAFLQEVQQFSEQLAALASESTALAQAKRELQQEHQALEISNDQQLYQIDFTHAQIEEYETKLFLQSERQSTVALQEKNAVTAQQRGGETSAQLASLSEECNVLKAKNSKLSTKLHESEQSVEQETNVTQLVFTSAQQQAKDLDQSDLQALLEQLRNMIEAHHANEGTEQLTDYAAGLQATCFATQELGDLSDFSLNRAHSILRASRTAKQLGELASEKEHEESIMKRALASVKEKFPVHHTDKSDPIDATLGDFLNQSDRVTLLPFIRQSTGVYKFGTKTVLLKVERNKIQVKVGGGFLPIENFLEAYEITERERVEAKEYNPSAKRMMGKWAEGIIGNTAATPTQMKHNLIDAMVKRSRTSCLAIRRPNSGTKSSTASPSKRRTR